MNSEEKDQKHIQNTSWIALFGCMVSLILKIISASSGKTTLQYIDVSRSLLETTVVVVWWYLCTVRKEPLSDLQRAAFNKSVRVVMIFSGILMAVFATFKYTSAQEESGWLNLGFLVSLLGVTTNTFTCVRYMKKANENPLVRRQGMLFAIKALADASVAITLMISMLFPNQPFTVLCKLITSLAVSAAMVLGGIVRD